MGKGVRDLSLLDWILVEWIPLDMNPVLRSSPNTYHLKMITKQQESIVVACNSYRLHSRAAEFLDDSFISNNQACICFYAHNAVTSLLKFLHVTLLWNVFRLQQEKLLRMMVNMVRALFYTFWLWKSKLSWGLQFKCYHVTCMYVNGLFPHYLVPLYQNKSLGKTFHMKTRQFELH